MAGRQEEDKREQRDEQMGDANKKNSECLASVLPDRSYYRADQLEADRACRQIDRMAFWFFTGCRQELHRNSLAFDTEKM